MDWRDVLALTVGGVIGADVYVASTFAGDLGPAFLVLWVGGALLALAIALAFCRCVLLVPKNGGPYLYARLAFGPGIGFLVGWATLLAQWSSLAVLPTVFSHYLATLFPALAHPTGTALTKTFFLAVVTVQNYRGTGTTRRVNDLLTAGKVIPLGVLILAGGAYLLTHPGTAAANLGPWHLPPLAAVGAGLIPVFWAYAGFELGTIPAEQVTDPQRSIPLALIVGTLICAGIYLALNTVVLATTPASVLGHSQAPLSASARTIVAAWQPSLAQAAGLLVAAGALLSTLGTAGAVAFATAHLVAAMAATGLLPAPLARPHPRFGTPYLAILTLTGTALAACLAADLRSLLGAAVFFLSLTYLSTSLAAIRLSPEPLHRHVIPALAALGSLFLLANVGRQPLLAGLLLEGAGAIVYLVRRPRAPLVSAWAGHFHHTLGPHVLGDTATIYSARFLPSLLKLLLPSRGTQRDQSQPCSGQ